MVRYLLFCSNPKVVMHMQRIAFHFCVAAGLWLSECGSSAQANGPGAQVVEAAVLPGQAILPHLGDPFVISDPKRHYLFGTASSSEGFQCYESMDLINWKLDGWAWRVSGIRVARRGLRAPRVFVYQGLYYLGQRRVFLLRPRVRYFILSTAKPGSYCIRPDKTLPTTLPVRLTWKISS